MHQNQNLEELKLSLLVVFFLTSGRFSSSDVRTSAQLRLMLVFNVKNFLLDQCILNNQSAKVGSCTNIPREKYSSTDLTATMLLYMPSALCMHAAHTDSLWSISW